jgi:hypothetical protein
MCPQGSRAATKKGVKDPPLTSPPSRGREERGHTIAVNRASSNESAVKNRASGKNL